MHKEAIDHLRERDPKLARIIDRIGDCRMEPRTVGSHFDALLRAIVYQQLSGKAAATIHGRVEALYGNRPPTPEEILATDDEKLRAAGLSWQKISYIKDLASKVASGELSTDTLDSMSDDEIIESLVRVKGIGRWSAQMFLMFRLGRPNVLPDLDLGVQKGIQHAYRLPKLPTPKDVLRIGERWAPYASVASWYMWRLLELPDVIRREARARSDARANAKPASDTSAKTSGTRSKRKAGERSRNTSSNTTAASRSVRRKKTVATKTTARSRMGTAKRAFRAAAAKKSTSRKSAATKTGSRRTRR
jgi:DNA-3-methyladenine glycosylase II